MATYALNTYINDRLDTEVDLGEHASLADAIEYVHDLGPLFDDDGNAVRLNDAGEATISHRERVAVEEV